MSSNVVRFNGITSLDYPAETMLSEAAREDLKCVVIIGERKDGREYFASSIASGPAVLWMIECAKTKLLAVDA